MKPAIFFLPFAAFMTAIISIMVVVKAPWFGTAFFVLVGIIPLCAGLYFVIRKRVTLYSEPQGIMWQQGTLLGMQRWHRMGNRQKVLNLDVGPPERLIFPPSVASLAGYSSQATGKPKDEVLATNVVEAALLGLLSHGVLEVQQAKIFTTTRDRGDGFSSNSPVDNRVAYLISLPGVESHPTVEGTLEGHLLELVRNWPTSSHVQESAFSPTKLPLMLETQGVNASFEPYWPLAPTIYLLVRSIFGKDRTSPDRWLLDLVGKDGVTRGLFIRRQRGWMKSALFEPVLQSVHPLIAEVVSLRTWSQRVAQQQTEFANALEKEIRSAIHSRKTSGD